MSKLLEFQKKVGAIKKGSINPFFKSAYFDINQLIEVIKPILNELDIRVSQPLMVVEGRSAVRTELIDAETDKVLDKSMVLIPDDLDAQKMGAAITYLRRYSLQSLLFLQAEDDDGNFASGKKLKKGEIETTLAKRKVIPVAQTDDADDLGF